MDNKFMKRFIMLAIILLDKQEGMPVEEWEHLRKALEEAKTGEARDVIDNVTVIKDRAFLDETWVEKNFHYYE